MALFAFGGSAHADVSLDYSLGYDYFSGTLADPVGPVSTFQSRTYTSAQGGSTTATGYASASYGVLKTNASSISSPKGPGSPATVNAYFNDSIVFSSDGLNGQAGFATIPIGYNWALNTAGASGNVVADLNIRLGGTVIAYVGESLRLQCSTPTNCQTTRSFQRVYNIPGSGIFYGDTPASVVPITVPIVFGQTYALQVRLGSSAASGSLADLGGEGESDASHSYYWGGISAITDASGRAVAATLSSVSGTDYLNAFAPAVPEPAGAALLMVGLGVVAALRRRRQISMKFRSTFALAAALLAGAASAAPVVGQVSFSGFGDAIGSAGMGASTGIDFVSGAAGSASPGVAGSLVTYGGVTGSFASLGCANFSGSCGTIKDIASFTTSTPISSFLTFFNTGTSANYGFDLTSITNVTRGQDALGGYLVLTGSGTIHVNGFDDTAGVFSLTSQGNNLTSYSATLLAAPVPEPGTLALMAGGFGVLMLGVRRKS